MNEADEAQYREVMAAHHRTVNLARASENVDRTGWTRDQWVADARHYMQHPDGSIMCLMNGHVNAMLDALGAQESSNHHGSQQGTPQPDR